MHANSCSARLVALTVLGLTVGVGCDIDYFSHLAIGQIGVLARTVPIDQAINDSSLTETERSRLMLVKEVRRFGIDAIGLKESDAYTVFDPNGMESAAYVLTACAKDRFEPYSWTFPIVGTVQYKGFFDVEKGRPEALRLKEEGYDVFYGRADGFSTLGVLPDPVRQSNLSLDEIELTELILHELTHNTIFKASDTSFNEAMASFVGRAAAQLFFDERFGSSSVESVSASMRFEDKAVTDEYVGRLYEDAKSYYEESAARGDSKEAIIAGREAVFAASLAAYATEFEPRLHDPDRWRFLGELPLDNAVILGGVRYQGGLEDFRAVFEKLDGDFRSALQVFAEAAAVADSRGYLQTWVLEH